MLRLTLSGGSKSRAVSDGVITDLLRAWLDLCAKQRSRRQLGRLDNRLLLDIGIDPKSAQEEAQRSIWE